MSRRQSCTEKEFRNAAKVGRKDLQCVWKSKDKELYAEKWRKMQDVLEFHGRGKWKGSQRKIVLNMGELEWIFNSDFKCAPLSPGVGYFGELISTSFQSKLTKGFFTVLNLHLPRETRPTWRQSLPHIQQAAITSTKLLPRIEGDTWCWPYLDIKQCFLYDLSNVGGTM